MFSTFSWTRSGWSGQMAELIGLHILDMMLRTTLSPNLFSWTAILDSIPDLCCHPMWPAYLFFTFSSKYPLRTRELISWDIFGSRKESWKGKCTCCCLLAWISEKYTLRWYWTSVLSFFQALVQLTNLYGIPKAFYSENAKNNLNNGRLFCCLSLLQEYQDKFGDSHFFSMV